MPLWLIPIWTFLRHLTWKEIAAAVLTVGAALIYIKGKHDGVAREKTKRLEQEARDRETLDRLKPSSGGDTVDRLRDGGF